MPILDAALAFAITMLLVATVVTQVVQILQQLFKRRSSEFERMLREYFQTELKPVVRREMHRLSSQLEQTASDGIEQACEALKLEELVPEGLSVSDLKELSTAELKEVLKRSALGRELLRNLGDEAEKVFDALGERYDALGAKFTDAFRRHSRRWATVVALVLAALVNIDSLFIADTYFSNRAVRDAVTAQSEAVLSSYDELAKRLSDEGREPTVQDLQQAMLESRRHVETLQGGAFPIGWTHFPHARLFADASPDEASVAGPVDSRRGAGHWIQWLIGILLTAFCAGLGAPFWYDTLTGIARAVQKGSEG